MEGDTGLRRRSRPNPRRFGLLMAGVCAVMAGWLAWQGSDLARFPAILMAALAGFAVVVPRILKPLEAAWMWLADRVGRIGNTVILTVFFFLILTPVGWLARLTGRDRLTIRSGPQISYWERLPLDEPTDYSKPF